MVQEFHLNKAIILSIKDSMYYMIPTVYIFTDGKWMFWNMGKSFLGKKLKILAIINNREEILWWMG